MKRPLILLSLLLALLLLPAQGWAETLIASQPVTLSEVAPVFQTDAISVDPLTALVTIQLQRPTTAHPLDWTESGRLRVSLVLVVDGVEHRVVGTTSGGVHQGKSGDLETYVLAWKPTVSLGEKAQTFLRTAVKDRDGYVHNVPLSRLGETGSIIRAYVRLERLSGTIRTAIVSATTTEAPAPTIRHHQSIAFDAATDAQEVGGDGVISLTHTSTGSNLAYFCGGGSWNGNVHTSCTYNGVAATELWDSLVDTYSNAGYAKAGQATGAQTVTLTMSAGASHHMMGVVSLTGVDQTTPVGTAATASGTDTTITVTVGSVGATDLVIDNVFSEDPTPPSVGANQTVRNTEIAAADTVLLNSTQSGVDGGVMSWASNGLFWIIGAVAFKEAAGGGPTGPPVGSLSLMGVGR